MKITQEFYRGQLDTYFDQTYGDITKQDFLGEGSVTTFDDKDELAKEKPLEMQSGLIDIQITSNRPQNESSLVDMYI